MGTNKPYRAPNVSNMENLVSCSERSHTCVDIGAFLMADKSKSEVQDFSGSYVSNDDDDDNTIATFADDDIFTEFLDSTTDDLYEVFYKEDSMW
jgi:hypothetical protein